MGLAAARTEHLALSVAWMPALAMVTRPCSITSWMAVRSMSDILSNSSMHTTPLQQMLLLHMLVFRRKIFDSFLKLISYGTFRKIVIFLLYFSFSKFAHLSARTIAPASSLLSPLSESVVTAAVKPTPDEPRPVVATALGAVCSTYLNNCDLATENVRVSLRPPFKCGLLHCCT